MEFGAMVRRAMDVRQRYAELERARYGRAWTDEEIALGFVGDVGDLAKPVMARNGIRTLPDADERLAHELADCLWSVCVLAQLYGIDLEHAFLDTMDELKRHITSSRQR